MKRTVILLVPFFLFTLLIGNIYKSQKRLSDYLVSEEVLSHIMETREKTEDRLIKELYFNQSPLMLDSAENRWFYSIVANQPDKDNPFVNYKTQNSAKNLRIAFCGKMPEGSFLAYTDNSYRLYQVVVTKLPIIRLSFEHEGSLTTSAPVSMVLFDNRVEASQRIIESEGTFHLRGSTVRKFPKHYYKFSLYQTSNGKSLRPNVISLLGMNPDNDWLLYPAYNDQEKIRNVFSSNLWYETCASNNAWKVPFGNEYRYVEAFANDNYIGLYALGFPINKRQLHLGNNDSLFKKIQPVSLDAAYELKFGDPDISWQVLGAYKKKLQNPDISDLLSSEDLQNAADIYLFMILIQGSDNVWDTEMLFGAENNFYMVFKNTDTNPVFVYVPWDMDMTWGNHYSPIQEKNNLMEYEVPVGENHFRMFQNPVSILMSQGISDVIEYVYSRYAELRSDEWSDRKMDERINTYEFQIFDSGAFNRDRLRWPEANHIDEAIKLSRFRDFLHGRLREMDSIFLVPKTISPDIIIDEM